MRDEQASALPGWAVPETTARPRRRVHPVRLVLGFLLLVVAVAVAAASVAGVSNPWRNVALQIYFGEPVKDVMWFLLLVTVAAWLLVPVRSEAEQHGRVWLRWGLLAAFLLTFPCMGLVNGFFHWHYDPVAHTTDRELVVATQGDSSELRIWAGTGLGKRDVGRVGPACGAVRAEFPSRDQVDIKTSYGDFTIHLDPVSGKPRNVIGPTCYG